MTPELAATLADLPDKPGVYLMRDARRSVLYVGKAQSLRSRVRSYWQKRGAAEVPLRIESALDRVVDVEYTLTDTVSEALLLEANLIKRYQPRFNVRLKDDKSYPFIKVTLADDFPRIERTRKLPRDGSRYFGPYASASSVDEAMNLIRRLFPFRTCTIDIRDGQRALQRPCLLYHIKRCQGPCVEAISREAYRRDIEQVVLFLEGRQATVARALRAEMDAAAERLDYERAAALRDKVRAIERTMESQKMAADATTEQDVLGFARGGTEAAVQVFAVRDGKLVARDVFVLENVAGATDAEALAAFVKQYYAEAGSVPVRILLPQDPADADELLELLTARRGRRVAFHVPRRGRQRELLELAARNAAETLAREQARWLADEGKTLGALEELAEALELAAIPTRIECYDISTIQGTSTVGSMVVFEDGRPAPASTVASGSGPCRAPTTSPATRRCCDAASGTRCGPGRGRPRSSAGGCRTWSSSTAARARSAPPGASSTSSACTTCRWSAWPRSARSSSGPAARSRSSCRPRAVRSTSSSACATRRTASPSPTTARCARRRRCAASSTTCPAWDRPASGRCCASSARRARSARRASSRSPPCRASEARWRAASRPPSTPESAPHPGASAGRGCGTAVGAPGRRLI